MPDEPVLSTRRPVTRGRLAADLAALGLREGATAMVHSSMSSLGWVVGGSQTVVEALLDCLGPAGTLCAQASWEDIPVAVDDWPAGGGARTRRCPRSTRGSLAAGGGHAGTVGAARAHLFDAGRLTEFAVRWLERRWPAGTRG